jgi:hypothetical protein
MTHANHHSALIARQTLSEAEGWAKRMREPVAAKPVKGKMCE